ncbi:MAG: hypothetical protein WA030_01130 [Candidatus Microsaccharimonas sp.]
MSHFERTILSTSEEKLTGSSIVSTSDSDRVRIDVTEVEEGTIRYSVTSRLELGRSAITAIMATPVYYSSSDWTEVRDGLRDISYPSRRVIRASRNSEKRTHLKNIGPASRELADIMTGNQAYQTQTANIPIFTVGESLDYANEEVLRRTSAGKLVLLLKGIGVDAAKARQLSEFAYYSGQSEDVVKELQAITGLDEESMHKAENSAILEQIDRRVWAELVHRLQDSMFMGFMRQATFEDGTLHYGGDDAGIFILEKDVPKNISESARNASVEVGRKMRDPDRATNRDRYEVTFLTEEAKLLARPRLVWEVRDGKRELAFPVRNKKDESEQVSRPSSMLGAALAANYGRFKYGIPYARALSNRLFPRTRWYSDNIGTRTHGGAGMLPLVINHHQATLMSDDYFTAIEEALE